MSIPTPSTTTALAQATPSENRPTNHHPHLPREVWPLLGTIGTTELIAAGVIAWFSAPNVAPAAITGLGVGAAGAGVLALVLRLIGKLAAPRPASQRSHRSV